jgi:hypothetical protein
LGPVKGTERAVKGGDRLSHVAVVFKVFGAAYLSISLKRNTRRTL